LRLPYLEFAIREIIVCWKRIREKDGKMTLVAAGKPRELLEAIYISNVFGVYANVESAVDECRS